VVCITSGSEQKINLDFQRPNYSAEEEQAIVLFFIE